MLIYKYEISNIKLKTLCCAKKIWHQVVGIKWKLTKYSITVYIYCLFNSVGFVYGKTYQLLIKIELIQVFKNGKATRILGMAKHINYNY